MREGSLEAPVRKTIPWQNEAYTNEEALDKELRRVFDICHGCRRCFNLCDSFPRLFDLIDDSATGELDKVDSRSFKHVVDACTLCDMCFMTKCPYVPPHEFDLDFPHLMLRYRAVEFKKGKVARIHRELTETDRNGKIASFLANLINFCTRRSNKILRFMMEIIIGIDRKAKLPRYYGKTFLKSVIRKNDKKGSKSNRKVVIYSTCYVNFNNPGIGDAALELLANNGVQTEVVYPACCGMPQLEQGNLKRVASNAKKVAAEILPWVDNGYDVIALVPSCSLMLKFEWPLLLPEDEDIVRLSKATFDISEYLMNISKKEGLRGNLTKIDGGITLHLACHSRAQNMGSKAAELMRLIPDTNLNVIERCSGHGGSWGMMKENFNTAHKVGKPAARKAVEANNTTVVSECPLARDQIVQWMENLSESSSTTKSVTSLYHPIEIFAQSSRFED